MNLKTTLVLLILVVAGGVLFFVGPILFPAAGPRSTDLGSRAVLEKELGQVERIQVVRGGERITFQRGGDGTWTLPGGWPTRKAEVDRLVKLVAGLESRFEAKPLNSGDEKAYGLDAPAVTVEVKTPKKEYRLSFGEEPATSNRFTRSTYVQIADRDGNAWKPRAEAIRLGPGILAQLDRPADYYQQRRLFPHERVSRDGGGQFGEKVDQLKAQGLAVQGAKAGYTLDRQGDDWTLTAPAKDRPDPDKMKNILRSVADIWAERFVVKPGQDLAEYGLDKPEQTITVRAPGADKPATLLIGKEGGELKKVVSRPPPPGLPPGLGAMNETVIEKLRYAKLADNDLIFEIRTDPLKDVFIDLKDLRDARLARFRADDVVKLEVTPAKGEPIVLIKADNKWKMEKPQAVSAESAKVSDLLDKLSQLRASGDDVIEKADAKAFALDPAATKVTVEVEEEVKKGEASDAKAEKKKQSYTFLLGKHDAEKKKLYAMVEGWPRVNAVDDDVLALVNRPAVAYRGRDVFDFTRNDLAAIEVQRPGEQYTLKQKDGVWRLVAPVDADADPARAGKLAGDLSRLSAVEHVAADVKPEELEKQYGLDKEAMTVTLTFKEEAKKTPLTLRVGKSRPGKEDFYAKLDSEPGVFVVDKVVRDELMQPSLGYRPLELWRVQPVQVAELRVQKQGEDEYHLVKGDGGWKIAGPFVAPVNSSTVQLMLDNLAPLRAERFVAHTAKDAKEYGLDSPALKITLLTGPSPLDKFDKEPKDKPTERTLLVGAPTKDGPPGHFAKLSNSDAVFVLGLLTYSAIDHKAVDLLDRKLLAIDPKTIVKVEGVSGANRLVLEKKDNVWQVASAEPPFTPDSVVLDGMLSIWSRLDADRIAAFGPKLDWAKYGLEKPAAHVTITVQKDKDDKPTLHAVAVGQPVGDAKGPRYARVDGGQAVAVISAPLAGELSRSQLDLVDHQLLKLNAAAITSFLRKMGPDELEIAKRDDGWFLTKPSEQRADDATLDKLAKDLASLRATRIAAYHSKDLRSFGLDDPAALLTIRYSDAESKPAEKLLKIGETADAPGTFNGDRFAMVDGSPVVGVLPGPLVRLLVGKPVLFRDRAIARFANADRLILERGPRTAVFANVDGTWQQIQPIKGDAEQAGLDDLVSALARLRADELVADKAQPTPEELQPFGLDRPEIRWRFLAGDKEVLLLTIGGKEKVKDGEPVRVYARAGDGDLVFLLNPKLTQQVLGEYRRRALWPPVDAFQAERLDFNYSEAPFAFVKQGADWQAAGKPDLKLRPQAVNEAVAALANLKAERTVIDKDADLKLFGLDPPQLVIELQVRGGGKRTLAIGNAEGDSKRRYARVLGGSRDDVFVLSEEDTAKLFRTLADFQAK